MRNNVQDIMTAHSMEVGGHYYLQVPGTIYQLSVVPEYGYYYRDENQHMHRSKTPMSVHLNCAVMEPTLTERGILWKPIMYREFNCEEDFYDFMVSMKQCQEVAHGVW